MKKILDHIERLNEIGIALSAEKDTRKLLELIMMGAKSLTHAEGGSLYFVQEDVLTFEIISNDRLGIQMGGTSGEKIVFAPLPLKTEDGEENHNMVVTHCVLTGETVNIENAYNENGFDFTGAREFDEKTGYRTRSMLTLPLKDHQHEIIGVLQLINATDQQTGEVIAFDEIDEQLAESLASQAAVALTQKRLINELQVLFESFIKMIASAIDDKSPYTGGHCRRIPVLTMMLADAVDKNQAGPLKDFSIDEKDRYELETAAWLHDCGKVVTPEYIMDKSTKLETIYDRIQLIEARYEILLRDAEIEYLKAQLNIDETAHSMEKLTASYHSRCEELRRDIAFLQRINIGSEYMSDEQVSRVHTLARQCWVDMQGQKQKLISDDELENLSIQRGTLNAHEREVINYHIVATIKMLESLPFPNHLKMVPEYAGGHHEKMDGSGYPKGLTRDQMSVQARIMAIADIFEALSASDRPYKQGKKLSECLKIMSYMKKDHHIDPDLFDIFIKDKVYLKYAEEFLDPEQIDDINDQEVMGYLN
jgi:HD-GYP domain-containing protein (c-di-GMP phosphodiesterase class II)